ncbi:hypothetical protein S100333_02229 [Bacillus subtilis subsp. subtilis]|nr:hypothetical protein S100333_02229 [Bacillus subtilis subsp. subtilis]
MDDIHKIERLAAASWPAYFQKKHRAMASQSEFWRNQKGK